MESHTFQTIKKRLCLFLILGLCGLGTACGDTPQAAPNPEEQQEYHYSIQFREIPDPGRAIYESDILEGHEDCQVLERGRIYQGGCIYRFLAIVNEDESNSYYENVLQVFREDTWNWEEVLLHGEGWIEGRNISVNALVGAAEEGGFPKTYGLLCTGGRTKLSDIF